MERVTILWNCIQVQSDPVNAENHKQQGVIDESGDDQLFSENYFAIIELHTPLNNTLLAAV